MRLLTKEEQQRAIEISKMTPEEELKLLEALKDKEEKYDAMD